MLTLAKQILVKAQKEKYAVGAFNTSDLELTKAIISAAEKLKAPVIVATTQKAIEYAGLETLAALIKEEAENANVPVVLHLDHGRSIEIVEDTIDAGYTSVMFDGSNYSLNENIRLTKEAVELSHQNLITCEAELGAISKAGVSNSSFTNPKDVKDFVNKTKADFLAVSIGSKHGMEKSERLEIELLKKIKNETDVPLVLHGASGVLDEDIRKAIDNGICKINIDTDIRHTFAEGLREVFDKFPELDDPRELFSKAILKVQNLIEEKIILFGSNGKA